MTTQNLQNAAKALLRGKFIAIKAYIQKQGNHQIKNLNLHLKQIEKEDLKKIQQREITHKDQNRNKIEMNKKGKVKKMKSCFFEKINKIDKPVARFIKKK